MNDRLSHPNSVFSPRRAPARKHAVQPERFDPSRLCRRVATISALAYTQIRNRHTCP